MRRPILEFYLCGGIRLSELEINCRRSESIETPEADASRDGHCKEARAEKGITDDGIEIAGILEGQGQGRAGIRHEKTPGPVPTPPGRSRFHLS